MNPKTKYFIILIAVKVFDVVALPAVLLAAVILKLVRRGGVERMPISKFLLLRIGVFPIRNHYYEPLFDERNLRGPLSDPRKLPGINWNISKQLQLLSQFHYNEELQRLPEEKQSNHVYYFGNTAFGTGDGEYFYNLIRLKKPKRIVEIGSGYSTLMAIEALKVNRREGAGYHCEHICIEPYEMPWLEQAPVKVIRTIVEEADRTLFSALEANDILFIDSSHMIRPQGDVLFEYLELLPTLKAGVIVHIHDIFSPRDYPADWIIGEVRFWNEQYLLEAFLSNNSDWEIIGAINHLHRDYPDALRAKCPRLKPERRPGSFYIQKLR